MSTQPWYGLSHTRAWGDVGNSYSALAQAELQTPDRDGTRPGGRPYTGDPAAGVLSRSKPRGAGTFQLQGDWSLSPAADAGKAVHCSEVADKFRSPPNDARPADSQAQKGKSSSFPKEMYPSDFKTTKQIDFDAKRLKDCKMPTRAHCPPDSGIMLGGTCINGISAPKPLALVNSNLGPAKARVPLSDGTTRDTDGIIVPTYNIINGDQQQHGDMEKYWHRNQLDFRRRR